MLRQELSNVSQFWTEAANPPSLVPGTAHVWLSPLDLPGPASDECYSLLSPDENERAARFRSKDHGRHYAAGRGLLRKLLASYINADPASLSFSYNQYGKPLLDSSHHGLSFNVSHSHGWALFGFTLGVEIGVDIEKERPDFATMEIAERFFAPEEVGVLQSLSPPLRCGAFFNCWTRKEAFIKAHGQGLSLGLDKFVVAFAPGAPPALLRSEIPDEPAEAWTIHDLPVIPGYKGALAVKAAPMAVQQLRLPASPAFA